MTDVRRPARPPKPRPPRIEGVVPRGSSPVVGGVPAGPILPSDPPELQALMAPVVRERSAEAEARDRGEGLPGDWPKEPKP